MSLAASLFQDAPERNTFRDLLLKVRQHAYAPTPQERGLLVQCQAEATKRATGGGVLVGGMAYAVPYCCARVTNQGQVRRMVNLMALPKAVAEHVRLAVYGLARIPPGTRTLTALSAGALASYLGGASTARHCLGKLLELETAKAPATLGTTGDGSAPSPVSPLAAEARHILMRYAPHSPLLDRGLGRTGPHTERPERPFLAGPQHVDKAALAAAHAKSRAMTPRHAKKEAEEEDNPFLPWEVDDVDGGGRVEANGAVAEDDAFMSRRKQKEEARRAQRRELGAAARAARAAAASGGGGESMRSAYR